MELRNLTNNPTDYLDAYCDAVVGHTNWAFVDGVEMQPDEGEIFVQVTFYLEPEKEAHEDA